VNSNFILDDVDPKVFVSEVSVNQLQDKLIVVGIHITTLNALISGTLNTGEFKRADLVYADGVSVSLLGKLFGLNKFQRLAMTDLIRLFLDAHSDSAPFKVALLGGENFVSDLAAKNWKLRYPEDSVWSHHGYETNWTPILEDLRYFAPDLVLVGLGMPLELRFLNDHYEELPKAIYFTCGGYLRLLAGVEKRAPKLFQEVKLEWLYRLVFSPKRTFSRYSRGVWTLLKYGSLAIRDK